MREKWKQWQSLFSWAPKSLGTVTSAIKLKDTCSLGKKATTNLNCIKQRHPFADKGPYSQRYGFSSSHVQVWEKSVVRFRTFPVVWELLWYSCSPVCDSPAWRLYCVANGHLLQDDLMPYPGTPRTAVARASVSVAGHCWLMPLQETLKHSKAGLPQSPVGVTAPSLGLGTHRFCLCPPTISGRYEVWV